MSNNTRANRRISGGMFSSLLERSDDFFIDKFAKGDKGLLSVLL